MKMGGKNDIVLPNFQILKWFNPLVVILKFPKMVGCSTHILMAIVQPTSVITAQPQRHQSLG